MIRTLLLGLILAFTSGLLHAQDPKIEDIERKNDKGAVVERYRKVDGKIEGLYTSWFDNGKISAQGNYAGGEYDGAWNWYHNNGQKRFSGAYNGGKLEGQVSRYHENGRLACQSNFTAGRAKGAWAEYYDSGQVSAKGDVVGSGFNDLYAPVHSGKWTWYYTDGVLSYEGVYKEGKPDGPATAYHANSGKHAEGTFVDGVLKGAWSSYFENGQLASTGEAYGHQYGDLKYPLRTGPWVDYHTNGKPRLECAYIEHAPNGPCTEYYDSGAKWVVSNYERGTVKGAWVSYFPNGKTASTGEAYGQSYGDHKYPHRTGPWVDYHDNGNKRFECNWVQNQRDGDAVTYYPSGAKNITCTFDNGTLTGTWTSFHEDGQTAALGEARGQLYGDYTYPYRIGLWVEYFPDGNRSFEGTYTNNLLDGNASWYHRGGKKAILAECIEGVPAGPWTQWYDNGTTRGHGHVRGMKYGSVRDPIKQGPWTWYFDSGKKESEGSYVDDAKRGPWVYYQRDGKVRDVQNHVEAGEEGSVMSAEMPDGTKVFRTTNPDGSTDTITVAPDGTIKDRTHTLPPDKQKPYVSYTDPDTGETVVVTHDSEGNPEYTTGTTTTDADGTKHTSEKDSDGTTRTITEKPDGSKVIEETRPGGQKRTTTRLANGTVYRHYDDGNGGTRDYTYNADGSAVRERNDADGKLIDRTTRDPSGVETTRLADGTEIRRHKDEGGNTVEVRTDADGNRSRVVRDPNGKEISRDDKWGERAPGEGLYEDIEGGTEWDKLTEEERKAYADRESKLRDGALDDARRNQADSDLDSARDAAADMSGDGAEAKSDLDRKPAAEDAKPRDNEKDLEKAGTFMKVLDWILSLPDTKFRMIQDELNKALSSDDPKDKALVAELLRTDRKGLAGFLARNPGIIKAWEEKVKPATTAASSFLNMALTVAKAVESARKGEWGDALNGFLDAGMTGLKMIPPSMMGEVEKDLGANPTSYLAAIKNMFNFGRELNRTIKPGDPGRNYGVLVKEGAEFVLNCIRSMPEADRKHFIERRIPFVRNALKKIEDGTPGGKAIVGLLDSAPEIYKLVSEWDTPNWAANMTAVAQKVGPKVIGILVKAQTHSDAAAEMAEFMAQVGTDYVAGHFTNYREAVKGAMEAKGQEAQLYARMRNEMQESARKAGMSAGDAKDFEFMSNFVSGHAGRMWLSKSKQDKDLVGIREAMQAWRRINKDLGSNGATPGYLSANVVDAKDRDNEEHYQRWLANQVNNVRRTLKHIDQILPEYRRGSAAYNFLAEWKKDLQHANATFGS